MAHRLLSATAARAAAVVAAAALLGAGAASASTPLGVSAQFPTAGSAVTSPTPTPTPTASGTQRADQDGPREAGTPAEGGTGKAGTPAEGKGNKGDKANKRDKAGKASGHGRAPVPTVAFTCDPDKNHGQNVSAYVHSLPKGPGRGRQVSQVARSDCGKPVPGPR